jgi:hypothetical protein
MREMTLCQWQSPYWIVFFMFQILFMSLHHPSPPTSLFIDDNGPYPALHNLPAK